MDRYGDQLSLKHKTPAAVVALAAAFAVAVPLPAQDVDRAAPIRIACEGYGEPSGSGGAIVDLWLDAMGATSSDLVVAGGKAKDSAFLLIGAEKVRWSGPFDTMILARPDVVVPLGYFRAEDHLASMPIELLRTDLIGSTVYVQGLRMSGEPIHMSMSSGLAVRFATGSVQPPLDYDGPPSTAILIADKHAEARYEVLHRVRVPTAGWTLEETSREFVGGATRIYMTLQEPAAGPPVIQTKRALIDLGFDALPVIEVWIRQTHAVEARPAPYLLAARIERDF